MTSRYIRRVVGSPAIMREQLERLLELNADPRATVQVVPFARGIHPGHIGPFIIMDFDDEDTASVLYLEGPVNDEIRERDRRPRGLPENL